MRLDARSSSTVDIFLLVVLVGAQYVINMSYGLCRIHDPAIKQKALILLIISVLHLMLKSIWSSFILDGYIIS